MVYPFDVMFRGWSILSLEVIVNQIYDSGSSQVGRPWKAYNLQGTERKRGGGNRPMWRTGKWGYFVPGDPLHCSRLSKETDLARSSGLLF